MKGRAGSFFVLAFLLIVGIVEASDVKCDGSLCVLNSSHKVEVKIEELAEENAGAETLVLTKSLEVGKNEICIEKEGQFVVVPTSECFRFGENELKWNSQSPEELQIRATQYKIWGPIAAPEVTLPENLVMNIHTNEGKTSTASVRKTGRFFFGYEYWADLGEVLKLSPEDKSGELMFYPKSRTLEATDVITCPISPEIFVSRPGMFITGFIHPGIEGVTVIAHDKDSGVPLAKAESDETGAYSLGPLRDDADYRLGARLEGYYFEREENGFHAIEVPPIPVDAQELIL